MCKLLQSKYAPKPIQDLFNSLEDIAHHKGSNVTMADAARAEAILTAKKIAVAVVSLFALLLFDLTGKAAIAISLALFAPSACMITMGSFMMCSGVQFIIQAVATRAIATFALGLLSAGVGYFAVQNYNEVSSPFPCALLQKGE